MPFAALVVALALLASACSSSGSEPANSVTPEESTIDRDAMPLTEPQDFELAGTQWRLTTLEGLSDEADAGNGSASLVFSEDGQVVLVSDGCGRVEVEIQADSRIITPGQFGDWAAPECEGQYNMSRLFAGDPIFYQRNDRTMILTAGGARAELIGFQQMPGRPAPTTTTIPTTNEPRSAE